jgi:hypothetical protein
MSGLSGIGIVLATPNESCSELLRFNPLISVWLLPANSPSP